MSESRVDYFQKNEAYVLFVFFSQSTRTPPRERGWIGGNAIYDFCKFFPGYHLLNTQFVWSTLRIEKILKEKMYFHKNSWPRGHDIQNFCKTFLRHHYNISNLSEPCSRVQKKICEEIHHTFYRKFTFPWGGGQGFYNFLSPYPTDATYLIWSRLALISSSE